MIYPRSMRLRGRDLAGWFKNEAGLVARLERWWKGANMVSSGAANQAPAHEPTPEVTVQVKRDASGTTWELNTPGGRNKYCIVGDGSVCCGEIWRNYAPSESAGSVTYAEFLSGRYQPLVESTFGPEVLQEVIAEVKRDGGHTR